MVWFRSLLHGRQRHSTRLRLGAANAAVQCCHVAVLLRCLFAAATFASVASIRRTLYRRSSLTLAPHPMHLPQRFWSLYASRVSDSLVVFYRTAASAAQKSVRSSISLQDGLTHRILLVANERELTLIVDDGKSFQQTLQLDGPIADCAPVSDTCVLLLGQRLNRGGVGGTLGFTGAMALASLCPGTLLGAHPDAQTSTSTPSASTGGDSSGYNLLDPAVSELGIGVTAIGGGALAFDGRGALRQTIHPPAVTQTFSFQLSVAQQAGTNGCKPLQMGCILFACAAFLTCLPTPPDSRRATSSQTFSSRVTQLAPFATTRSMPGEVFISVYASPCPLPAFPWV